MLFDHALQARRSWSLPRRSLPAPAHRSTWNSKIHFVVDERFRVISAGVTSQRRTFVVAIPNALVHTGLHWATTLFDGCPSQYHSRYPHLLWQAYRRESRADANPQFESMVKRVRNNAIQAIDRRQHHGSLSQQPIPSKRRHLQTLFHSRPHHRCTLQCRLFGLCQRCHRKRVSGASTVVCPDHLGGRYETASAGAFCGRMVGAKEKCKTAGVPCVTATTSRDELGLARRGGLSDGDGADDASHRDRARVEKRKTTRVDLRREEHVYFHVHALDQA